MHFIWAVRDDINVVSLHKLSPVSVIDGSRNNRLEGLVNADKGTLLSFSSKIAIWEEMEKQVSSSIVLEHADNQ